MPSQRLQLEDFNLFTSFIILGKNIPCLIRQFSMRNPSKVRRIYCRLNTNATLQSFLFTSLWMTLWASDVLSTDPRIPLLTTYRVSWKQNKDFIYLLHWFQFLPSRIGREFRIPLVPFIFAATTIHDLRNMTTNMKFLKTQSRARTRNSGYQFVSAWDTLSEKRNERENQK